MSPNGFGCVVADRQVAKFIGGITFVSPFLSIRFTIVHPEMFMFRGQSQSVSTWIGIGIIYELQTQ